MLTILSLVGSELELEARCFIAGVADPGTLKTFFKENSPVIASECRSPAGARLAPASCEYGEGLSFRGLASTSGLSCASLRLLGNDASGCRPTELLSTSSSFSPGDMTAVTLRII